MGARKLEMDHKGEYLRAVPVKRGGWKGGRVKPGAAGAREIIFQPKKKTVIEDSRTLRCETRDRDRNRERQG